MITISRSRYCSDTRSYIERRQADGLSKPKAIRCVKRYIARQTLHTIRADLASLRQHLLTVGWQTVDRPAERSLRFRRLEQQP